MRIRNALIVLLAVLLSGCTAISDAVEKMVPSPTPTCAEEVETWHIAVSPKLEEWFDAVELADSTSRVSLTGPISELQRIARDIKAVKYPVCAQNAYDNLKWHLDKTIDGFLEFMSQQDTYEATINSAFEHYKAYLYQEALLRMEPYRTGTPMGE